MRIKKLKTLFTLGLFTLVTLLACRKEEQPEMNAAADPCACASEVSADFTIEEAALWGSTSVWFSETDSILKNRHVKFTAKESDAEYTWYLGVETETTREAIREFGNDLVGTTQQIILVVKREPNLVCFPEDDGYDSIVKDLTITPHPINDQTNNDQIVGTKEGVFRVKEINSNDSIDITLDHVFTSFIYLNIFNYDGNGSNCIENLTPEGGVTYRETRIGSAVTNCKRLRGYIKTPVNQPVEMYFTIYEPDHSQYEEFHYFGRRVSSL